MSAKEARVSNTNKIKLPPTTPRINDKLLLLFLWFFIVAELMLLRDSHIYVQGHTASQTKRPTSKSAPLGEPQISQNIITA
jgi:hypothetical protein